MRPTTDRSANRERLSALVVVVAVFLLVEAWAEPAAVFRVTDYGAVAGDGINDAPAVRTAIEAAHKAGGGTVFFPSGVYEMTHLDGLKVRKVIIEGAGRDASVVRSLDPDRYVMTFSEAEDLQIRDLAFDANGARNYGGIRFYACKRVTITRTHYFDSNTAARSSIAPGKKTDIYPYVFGRGKTQSEDVVISDNLIEDLQLEVDFVRRATIVGNTVRRPVSTAGIGIFSLQRGDVEGEDVCGEDVLIQRNTIEDLEHSFVGIAVHLDPPCHTDRSPLQGVAFRNVRILDNTIVIEKPSKRNCYAIKLGQTDNSQVTANVVYDGIRIEGNRIEVRPGADTNIREYICLMTSRPFSDGPDFVFDNTSVSTNTLHDCGNKPFVVTRGKGANYREENNRRIPLGR